MQIGDHEIRFSTFDLERAAVRWDRYHPLRLSPQGLVAFFVRLAETDAQRAQIDQLRPLFSTPGFIFSLVPDQFTIDWIFWWRDPVPANALVGEPTQGT